MKALYYFLDTLLVGIWGITIIDLLSLSGDFDFINDSTKALLAIAGLVYLLVVKIPHEVKMNKLKRREKREQVEKLERENKKK